jgi:hypothetical protein
LQVLTEAFGRNLQGYGFASNGDRSITDLDGILATGGFVFGAPSCRRNLLPNRFHIPSVLSVGVDPVLTIQA